jgi:hypothetical protein
VLVVPPQFAPITIPDPADGRNYILQATSPNCAQQTLGVLLAPDGGSTTQLSHSFLKVKELHAKLRISSLKPKAKLMALESVISPAVLYPMVNVLFRQSNFHPIDSILSQLYCSTLGLNRNFLRAVLHSPTCLGGIGVPSPKHRITRDHINYFLYNV